MSVMDIEFFCNPCGKSWTYHDVDMARAELLNQWYNNHTHTPEEMSAYYQTENTAINIQDDTDD